LDVAWRLWLVNRARRRYRRNAVTVDLTVRRLINAATVNDRTLVLQLAAGLASAVFIR
jgi:hypothetical protein